MKRRIKNPNRFLVICAIVGVGCGVLFAAILSALFPIVVRDKIEARVASVETRFGLQIEIDEIKRRGLSGAELRGMKVIDADNGNTLVRAEVAGASVSLWALLSREIVVTDLWADQVDVVLTETDSGTFDLLEKIANRRASPKKTGEETSNDGPRRNILGGSLPELKTTDINIRFHTNSDKWPIQSLTIPEATIEDASTFNVQAAVSVLAHESDTWSLPENTTIEISIDQETLQPVGGKIDFDRAVKISGIGPLPFVVVGFSGVSFDEESNVNIKDVVVDMGRTSGTPLFASDDLSFSLIEWTLNPRDIRIDRLAVSKPRITDHVTEDGRAKSYDIRQIVRPQASGYVRLHAMAFAESIARKSKEKEKEVEEEEMEEVPAVDADPTDEPPSAFARIAEYLPRDIEITEASLNITDDRVVDIEGWAKSLEARDASLRLINDVENKKFKIDGSLSAFADANSRGAIKTIFGWEWETQKLDADIEISALDLLWFSQLAGPRIANQIRGGILQAKLDVTPSKGRAVKLDGLFSVKKLNLFNEKIAEEPISDFSASYQFTAIYDPAGKVPEAKLLKKPTLPEHVPADSALRRGSFEVKAGTATVNGVEISFRPEIYGTAALPRLPARIDVDAGIEEIDVQRIVDAVPAAILGPLEGSKFVGTFKWNLALELPLHHAKDMVWNSTPVLDEFEIAKLPHTADVRRLSRDMKIRIEDEVRNKRTGKLEPFTKYIYIPTYRAVPADWIVENMYVDEEELAAIRDSHPLPANAGKVTSSSSGTDPHQYVRLTDISPFLTRAVLTTEDKGFWRHSGISFVAMRESLAQNIRAGRIRRGGSTIAMQLIKNVFLDRKKIYARKLREVFMVYLMIHVANVPRDRMLEVYFNVIEFAPKLYGIHAASVHYFGKVPADLTLGEVAFLVSIIPGPKRYHYMWERGEIPDYWFNRMTRYINSMYKNEKVTEEERDEALLAPPEFYKPGPDDPPIKPKTIIPILPLDDGPVIPFDL